MGVPDSIQWHLLQAVLLLGYRYDTMVVATHGIVKKTMKTPVKEIAKAEEIRKEYFRRKKR